jgi:peptide/nickel transport system ATP-binding protein
MCERLLVMQHGVAVEEMAREALVHGEAGEDYTRDLMTASAGFTRS